MKKPYIINKINTKSLENLIKKWDKVRFRNSIAVIIGITKIKRHKSKMLKCQHFIKLKNQCFWIAKTRNINIISKAIELYKDLDLIIYIEPINTI